MKAAQVIFFTLILCYAYPSFSANWYTIPGTDWQGDWSRIRYDDRGNILIWTQSVMSSIRIAEKQKYADYRDYAQSKDLMAVNCKQETLSVQQTLDYAADGHVISSATIPSKFEVVAPGSIGEAIFNAVCPKSQ